MSLKNTRFYGISFLREYLQGRSAFKVYCSNALRTIFTAAAIGSLAVTPLLSFNHNGDVTFSSDIQNELVLTAQDMAIFKSPTGGDHKEDNAKYRYMDAIYRYENERRRLVANAPRIVRPLSDRDEAELRVHERVTAPGLDF